MCSFPLLVFADRNDKQQQIKDLAWIKMDIFYNTFAFRSFEDA